MIITTRYKLIDTDTFTSKDVSIADIAHSLSQQCRYNGNTPRHYSVAEHTVYVARLVKQLMLTDQFRDWDDSQKLMCTCGALCHDNPEYIYGDFIRPLKKEITGLKEIDAKVTPICENAMGLELTHDMRIVIDWADKELAQCEKRYFFKWAGNDGDWVSNNTKDSPYTLEGLAEGLDPGMEARAAKGMFLYTFHQLFELKDWQGV